MLQTATTAAVLAGAPPFNLTRDRLLRLSQVMDMIGLGRTRIYEMIKAHEFPAPCKPGGTASRWSENEVLAWLAECVASRTH